MEEELNKDMGGSRKVAKDGEKGKEVKFLFVFGILTIKTSINLVPGSYIQRGATESIRV